MKSKVNISGRTKNKNVLCSIKYVTINTHGEKERALKRYHLHRTFKLNAQIFTFLNPKKSKIVIFVYLHSLTVIFSLVLLFT